MALVFPRFGSHDKLDINYISNHHKLQNIYIFNFPLFLLKFAEENPCVLCQFSVVLDVTSPKLNHLKQQFRISQDSLD